MCILTFRSVGPTVQLLERTQTDTHTGGQTGPRTLPLPLMWEVKRGETLLVACILLHQEFAPLQQRATEQQLAVKYQIKAYLYFKDTNQGSIGY